MSKHTLSMHENVETWCDTCSCEPEPRWQAVEEELESDRKNDLDKKQTAPMNSQSSEGENVAH